MFSDQFSVSDSGSDVNLRRIQILNYKVQEHQIEEAWKRFENAGFKPLLIKGWAAAQYYPVFSERRFNDLDLVFAPSEFPRAEKFLEGFARQTIPIDLHEGLRHLDTLPFDVLYSRSEIIKCGTTDIRVLCREDHLRVLCVHWLLDGGAKKDKLWDIFYAVRDRPPDFDWERCLNAVSQIRKEWIICTIGVAHRFLKLEIDDLPFAESAKRIPEWLIKSLKKEWESGVFIVPIHFILNDRKNLWRQIKKRIPPNPIQATVEMEGRFDERSRVFYQIGNTFYRFLPAFERICRKLLPIK